MLIDSASPGLDYKGEFHLINVMVEILATDDVPLLLGGKSLESPFLRRDFKK